MPAQTFIPCKTLKHKRKRKTFQDKAKFKMYLSPNPVLTEGSRKKTLTEAVNHTQENTRNE